MGKQKVVILQDNQSSIEEVEKVFNNAQDFLVVGKSDDGKEGLKILEETLPDLLVVSLVLKNVDGFSVIEKVRAGYPSIKIIVISAFTSENIINRAMNFGAEYYIAKPFDCENVLKRLRELSLDGPFENVVLSKKSMLDEKISKIFISVGIPPHIKGYQYLREGVKMAVKNPDIINNITKQLYPQIGQRYSTTASKVERAIRHAIEVAWNRGRIETINSLLGIRAFIGNDKPTNGEFIALIADKMLLEGA